MNLQTVAHNLYKRGRGKQGRKALACVLRQEKALTERSQLLLERIQVCGRWNHAAWSPMGQTKRQVWCKHPLCPVCGQKMIVKEAHRQWDRIRKLNGGPDEVSYLTISLPGVPFTADFKAALEEFKKRLRYRFAVLGMKFAGQVQVSRNKDGSAKLHTHGVAYHPGRDRDEIQEYLRQKLQYGPRSVYLEEVKVRDGSLDVDALKGLRYAGLHGLRKTASVAQFKELLQAYEQVICHVRIERKNGEEVLRTRGRVGLRFEVGLNSDANRNDTNRETVTGTISKPTRVSDMVGDSGHQGDPRNGFSILLERNIGTGFSILLERNIGTSILLERNIGTGLRPADMGTEAGEPIGDCNAGPTRRPAALPGSDTGERNLLDQQLRGPRLSGGHMPAR